MWKFETLTLCKIETQIITKFVKNDYTDERNVYSEFGENKSTGEFQENGWIQLFVTIYLFIFSMKHREQTFVTDPWTDFNALWLKDAMCLFGGWNMKNETQPLFSQKPSKWPSIGNFQPKCCNMKFPVNAISTICIRIWQHVNNKRQQKVWYNSN